MNRNELERMLSEVDEKYAAELLDTEEITSGVTIIQHSRFGKWVAAAAAVCLCVLGGGMALGRLQGMHPSEGSSVTDQHSFSTDQHTDYDLIRESVPKELHVIDYTLEAGGGTMRTDCSALPLPEGEYDQIRSHFFCDENGKVVNSSTHAISGDCSVQVIISDGGKLFPPYFFVDFSGDADRRKPAIHIYDMTNGSDKQQYELYYLYNGIGMTMETYGYTEEEAVNLAASLIQYNVTSESLWEKTSGGFDYEVIHELLPEGLLDLSYILEIENGKVTTTYTPSLPYALSGFTASSAITYLDADSVVHNTDIRLESEKGSVQIILSDFGQLFSTRISPDISADADRDKAIIHMYTHPVQNSVPDYELFCVYHGVGLTMRTIGYTEEEAEAFAVTLLENAVTASSLYYATNAFDPFFTEKSDLFICDLHEVPRITNTSDESSIYYTLNDYTLPFTLEGDTYTGYGNIHCNASGTPFYADISMTNGTDITLDVSISQENDGMFGDTLPLMKGGAEYRGVTLYSGGNNPELIVTFIHDGTGYTISTKQMTQVALLSFVDAIIDHKFTLDSLPIDRNEYVSRPTFETMQEDARFGFAAPTLKEIGDLHFREDSAFITSQKNTETDSPEFLHTCTYRYINNDSLNSNKELTKFINCDIRNTLVSTNENPTLTDAASLTPDSVRTHGKPSITGQFSFDYIIPVNEYYITITANCTAEEMWTFLESILHLN